MAPTPDGRTFTARLMLRVLLAELAVLAATGTALFFVYRPTAAQAWDDLAGTADDGLTVAGVLRAVHQVTSVLALVTVLATAVLVSIEPCNRWRRGRSVGLGGGMALAVLAASGTGFLLPWDQFALWAVTVGSDMKGYLPLFGDEVRFVLLGGREIGKGTLLRWVFVHIVVGGPVAGGLVAWGLRRVRRGRTVPPVAAGG